MLLFSALVPSAAAALRSTAPKGAEAGGVLIDEALGETLADLSPTGAASPPRQLLVLPTAETRL